jgi:hypothetical protein
MVETAAHQGVVQPAPLAMAWHQPGGATQPTGNRNPEQTAGAEFHRRMQQPSPLRIKQRCGPGHEGGQDVMQVDVGQQGRDDRPLRCTYPGARLSTFRGLPSTFAAVCPVSCCPWSVVAYGQ